MRRTRPLLQEGLCVLQQRDFHGRAPNAWRRHVSLTSSALLPRRAGSQRRPRPRQEAVTLRQPTARSKPAAVAEEALEHRTPLQRPPRP